MSAKLVWGVAIGVVVLIGGGFLYLWLRSTGRKQEANAALADGIEAISRPSLEQKRDQLRQLEAAAQKDDAALAAARKELQSAKDTLAARFGALDLSPEEVAKRFAGLSV